MVRKDELADTTHSTEVISRYIHDEVIKNGISYDMIAEKLGRARSYVGLRLSGQKAWNFDELDIIANMLHLANAFKLVANAHKTINDVPQSAPQRKPLPPAPQAEIDDIEARLARSLDRYNNMKDYEVVADRSEREDEEFFD